MCRDDPDKLVCMIDPFLLRAHDPVSPFNFASI